MQIFTPHCTHAHLDGAMQFFTRWKVTAILLAALVVGLMFVPRFLTERFVSQPISLQRVPDLGPHGGTELLLEIDTDAVRKGQLQALTDDGRRVLRQARIPFIKCVVRDNGVEVQLTRDADMKAAIEKLGELSQPLPGIRFFNVDVMNRRSVDILVNGDLVTLTPSDAAIAERIRRAVYQSIEIIRRRVNELGLVEPTIQREGLDRILVQVPGLQDPTRVNEILGKTAKLEFRIVDLSMTVEQAIATHPPPDSEILGRWDGQKYLIEKRALVSGADIVDAQPSFDQRANEPLVSFRFNSSGARKFAEATRQNVGKPFAIVLDNQVLSVPVIQEPILGGSGQITGNLTVQQAYDLAILLRAGAAHRCRGTHMVMADHRRRDLI
jgi:preprotein translocase subunit SecD